MLTEKDADTLRHLAATATEKLNAAAAATELRNAAIQIALAEQGGTVAEIARLTGLTHQRIGQLRERKNPHDPDRSGAPPGTP